MPCTTHKAARKRRPCNASLASCTLNPAAGLSVPACCMALPNPMRASARSLQQTPSPAGRQISLPRTANCAHLRCTSRPLSEYLSWFPTWGLLSDAQHRAPRRWGSTAVERLQGKAPDRLSASCCTWSCGQELALGRRVAAVGGGAVAVGGGRVGGHRLEHREQVAGHIVVVHYRNQVPAQEIKPHRQPVQSSVWATTCGPGQAPATRRKAARPRLSQTET